MFKITVDLRESGEICSRHRVHRLMRGDGLRTEVGYPNRATATTDVFDYIEMFYNPIRRHGSAGDLSPVEFEKRYALNDL